MDFVELVFLIVIGLLYLGMIIFDCIQTLREQEGKEIEGFLIQFIRIGDTKKVRDFLAKHSDRFYLEDDTLSFTVGRWFQAVLNYIYFYKELHILPYINTLISLIFISLSGLVTAIIFNIKKIRSIILIICLVSITPYWAHLIYYNSVSSITIGNFLGIISVLLIIKDFRFIPLSLVLLACGIGTYQTILQNCTVIVMIWLIINDINLIFCR